MDLHTDAAIFKMNVMAQTYSLAGMIVIGMENAMSQMTTTKKKKKKRYAPQICLPLIQITTMTSTDGLNVIQVGYLRAEMMAISLRPVILIINAVAQQTLLGMIAIGFKGGVNQTQQILRLGSTVSIIALI